MRTVTDLDGVTRKWKAGGKQSDRASRPTSAPHALARQLLKDLFPTALVLEEVSIPVREKQVLYADFFVPLYNIFCEVQGAHHRSFVPFFHGTVVSYAKQKRRDEDKRAWCELNNFSVIYLHDNESLDEWKVKIERRNERSDRETPPYS